MTKPLVYNSKGPKNSIGQSSLTELTKLIISYAWTLVKVCKK
jgi:hypothetical protein